MKKWLKIVLTILAILILIGAIIFSYNIIQERAYAREGPGRDEGMDALDQETREKIDELYVAVEEGSSG